MSNEEFDAILAGRATRGAFDTRWAIVRLVEYAPWRELKQRLPHQLFLHYWPEIRNGVRSDACREGMDFMYERWHGQH